MTDTNTNTNSEISNSIHTYLQSKAACSQPLTNDQDLLLSGILDSLGIADLLAFLESEYAIKIALEDVTVENFATISTMTAFVARTQGS